RFDDDGIGIAAFAETLIRNSQVNFDTQFVVLEKAAQFADTQRRTGERCNDLRGSGKLEMVLLCEASGQCDVDGNGCIVKELLVAAAGVEPDQQGKAQGNHRSNGSIKHT